MAKTVKIGLLHVEWDTRNDRTNSNETTHSYYQVQILDEYERAYMVDIRKFLRGVVNSYTSIQSLQNKERVTDIKEIQVSNWDYFWNYKKALQIKNN